MLKVSDIHLYPKIKSIKGDFREMMKDKIINKAKEMFLRLGFKSITMDDIACEMCISKKTIYKYFSNKDILIEESIQAVHKEIRATLNKIAEEKFKIRRDDDGAFVVEGKDIEKLIAMTNFENDDALRRFQMIWRKLEIEAALKERGIKEGDVVRIRDMEFEFKL